MKTLNCSDLGSECSWKAHAETDEELRKLANEHGAKVHGMKEFSDELWEKAKAVIKEE